MLNVDLHCHSNCSDGTLSPTALAARAKDNGVDVWAMTDHDEIRGIAEARTAAQALSLPFVSGVEISTTWSHQTVHIVRSEGHTAALQSLMLTSYAVFCLT